MRIKDIQVGEKYKAGYGVGVEVLEKGIERSTYTGKTRRDGVRCRVFTKNRVGTEVVYSSQEIKELWEEHQARVEARNLANELREKNYEACKAKVEGYAEKLKAAGIEPRRIYSSSWACDDINDFPVSLELSNRQMEKIVALLEKPEAQERIAEAEKAQAAQSSSALDHLFGGATN